MEVRVPDGRVPEAAYVVEVAGDVDIATVDDLEVPVIEAIRGGCHPVIIDLTDCSFIDSSGIRLLIRARKALRDHDGDGPRSLAVVARDHPAELLRLTGVDKVIPVVPSRAEAEGVLQAG